MRRLWTAAICMLAVLALGGCERSMRNMYDQPRGKPYRANALFPDGSGSRTPPAGTVAHAQGARPGSSSGRLGAKEAQRRVRDENAQSQPYRVDEQLLVRGRQRFNVYCLPCHSPAGDGDGRVVRRGFPSPPSYHIPRLRAVPDRHIFDVITHGYGIMSAYADRVTPADRWAIVAYVRALQLSQHARVDRLPEGLAGQVRQALRGSSGAEAGRGPAAAQPGSGGKP